MVKRFTIECIYASDSTEISGIVVKFDKINLLRDVNYKDGTILNSNIVNKVLVYREATGSTVGSYMLYCLSKRGLKPKAILVLNVDLLTLVGAVLGDVPLFRINEELFTYVDSGDEINIEIGNANTSCICTIYKRRCSRNS